METVRLLIPLFAILGVGYGLKTLRVVPLEFGGQLGRLVFYAVLPAMLFSASKDVDLSSAAGVSATAAYLVTLFIVIPLSVLVSRLLPPQQRGAFAQAAFRPNLAYMGVAVTAQLYGDKALPIMAMILSGGVIIHATGTVVVLHLLRHADAKPDFARLLRMVLTNPIIISVAAGLTVAATGLTIPPVVEEPIRLLRRMSLPTVLLTVGFSIDFHEIAKRIGSLSLVVAFKLFLMPLIGFTVYRYLFDGSGDTLLIMTLACGMPTAVMAQSFASAMDADESLTAAAVSGTTLLILISVPILLSILRLFSGA